MVPPDVTVLIPSYNPGRFLCDALESVFRQTYENWRVILVDDASDDQSLSLAGQYLASDRVTLVRNPLNVGQSKSLNAGLALVRTPFAVQLDADDWFAPETLEVLTREASTQPDDVCLVSANLKGVVEDEMGHVVNTYVRRGRSFRDRYDFLVTGSSVWPRFYRTSALESIGGWPTDDPYEGRHMEDIRILLRLIEHYRFHWVDRLLYFHRRHANNNSRQVGVYNAVLEWSALDALDRWGGHYRPVFTTVEEDWKRIAALVPTDPASGRLVLRSQAETTSPEAAGPRPAPRRGRLRVIQ